MTQDPPTPELLTPAEVARMFRVETQTVSRWAKAGRLGFTRTLGGHRRFPAAPLYALLEQDGPSDTQTQAGHPPEENSGARVMNDPSRT